MYKTYPQSQVRKMNQHCFLPSGCKMKSFYIFSKMALLITLNNYVIVVAKIAKQFVFNLKLLCRDCYSWYRVTRFTFLPPHVIIWPY